VGFAKFSKKQSRQPKSRESVSETVSSQASVSEPDVESLDADISETSSSNSVSNSVSEPESDSGLSFDYVSRKSSSRSSQASVFEYAGFARSLPSRDRFLLVLVPTVMVLVALSQLSFGLFGVLTPWKGGGFGMFASEDRLGHRVIVVEFSTASGSYVADLSEVAQHHPKPFTNTRGFPHQGNLASFNMLLLTEFSWHPSSSNPLVVEPGTVVSGTVFDRDGFSVIESVHITVYRSLYSSPSDTVSEPTLTPVVLTEYFFEVDPALIDALYYQLEEFVDRHGTSEGTGTVRRGSTLSAPSVSQPSSTSFPSGVSP